MRLFEFDTEKRAVQSIVIVSDKLKLDLKNKKLPPEMSTDDLLRKFREYDPTLILDKTDLYQMIQKPPLKDIVKNIEQDKVIFKGTDTGVDGAPTRNQDLVKKMAKHALK